MTDTAAMRPAEPDYRKLPPVREPLRYDVTIASNCYSTKEMSASERTARQLLSLLQHIHPKTVTVNEREDELTGELTVVGLPEPVSKPLPLANHTVDGGVRLTVRFVREIIAHEVYFGARVVYPDGLERFANDRTYPLVDHVAMSRLTAYGLVEEFICLWDNLNCYHTDRRVTAARAIDRLAEAVRWQLAGQILREVE